MIYTNLTWQSDYNVYTLGPQTNVCVHQTLAAGGIFNCSSCSEIA